MADPSKKDQEGDLDEKLAKKKKELPYWHWGRIRLIGSLKILSIIPFVGAGIIAILGLPQFENVDAKRLLEDLWMLYSLLAFLIFLFSANIIYHMYCPPMVKKFESLAELYQYQLSLKWSQLQVYPNDDEFKANLDHIVEVYSKELIKHSFLRRTCLLLFASGVISLFYFLVQFRALLLDP